MASVASMDLDEIQRRIRIEQDERTVRRLMHIWCTLVRTNLEKVASGPAAKRSKPTARLLAGRTRRTV